LALVCPAALAVLHEAVLWIFGVLRKGATKLPPSAVTGILTKIFASATFKFLGLILKVVVKPPGSIFMGALILAFMFGRAYLLIECFVNVRSLDSRVFVLPSWTNYLPHIG
jgi:hypothetical protein